MSTFLTELRQKQPSRAPVNQEEYDTVGTPDATSGYEQLEMSRR